MIAAAPRFYDLRNERIAIAPKVRVRRGGPVWRDPERVDSIVLHQTAAVFGVSPAQIRRSAGDRDLALARRALGVACHAMAFRPGFFVAATPLRWHVNHGNGFNPRSLGLEVDGLFSGLLDDPTTIPRREDVATTMGHREPSIITAQIADAMAAAIRWLVEAGRAEGMPIKYLFAHRQSSATRRSDPGQGLWALALPIAAELGLETLPDLTLEMTGKNKGRRGYPIPRAWDPDATAEY